MHSLALILVALLMTSCGGSKSPTTSRFTPQSHADPMPPQGTDDPQSPPVPIENRISAAANGKLICAFQDECHPAVAMISAVTKKGIERCTGFLIAPDLVMTNDHCVDRTTAVLENGGNCDGLIYAHFAYAGKPTTAQSVSCASIVKRSYQKGLASMDYAIIQLKNRITDRDPVLMSSRGMRDGEPVTIQRVQMENRDPTTGTYNGVQVKTACEASYKTIVYPAVTHARSSLMTFGDCPIQEGNSGSPVFNSSGEVGTIIQGFLTLKSDPKIIDQLRATMLDETYGNVGLGTQTSCIPSLRTFGGECVLHPIRGQYPKEFVAALGLLDPQTALPKLPAHEQWASLPSPNDETKLFIQIPLCVMPSRTALSFQSSLVMFRRGLNHAFQAEWRSTLKKGDKRVTFTTATPAVSVNQAIEFNNSEFGRLQVPVCGNRGRVVLGSNG